MFSIALSKDKAMKYHEILRMSEHTRYNQTILGEESTMPIKNYENLSDGVSRVRVLNAEDLKSADGVQ